MKSLNLFSLKNQVAVITGAAGLLGMEHAQAIHDAGGIPILTDLPFQPLSQLSKKIGPRAFGLPMDVTQPSQIQQVKAILLKKYKRIDILINNAARNPKVEKKSLRPLSSSDSFEKLPLEVWNTDLTVGLTGTMLCSQIFGTYMAQQKKGVILNIASELALIAPNQSLYKNGAKKPASYSVVKSGLLGLTRYLATYWASNHVRVNALCPGGVENGQSQDFLERIAQLIPLQRMAKKDAYRGAIIFLCSQASSYMTGSILVIDGGRTSW